MGRRHDELLGAAHHVLAVGVGLVELEHRELGVVLVRDALVAEVLAELVDLLEPADDEPLEVELGRNAQIKVAVERVVMRDERTGSGAAVERLQHRRLDLDKVGLVQRATDARDHAGAGDEPLACLGVGHQVEVALAMPDLDVLQAVMAIRERESTRREERPLCDLQTQLAATRAKRGALHADEVANRDGAHDLVRLLTHPLQLGKQLHATGDVLEIDERDAALATPAQHAAADAPGALARLLGFELLLSSAQRTNLIAIAEPMWQGREVHRVEPRRARSR